MHTCTSTDTRYDKANQKTIWHKINGKQHFSLHRCYNWNFKTNQKQNCYSTSSGDLAVLTPSTKGQSFGSGTCSRADPGEEFECDWRDVTPAEPTRSPEHQQIQTCCATYWQERPTTRVNIDSHRFHCRNCETDPFTCKQGVQVFFLLSRYGAFFF